MTKAILKAIRDLLIADDALTTLLGGEYIYVAEIMQANQFPSVTLRLTSEGSKKRVSYNTFKKRDNSPIVQIDVWSKKSREETYKLSDRIDKLLISDAVPDTFGWTKISDGDMFEDDLRIFHKPLRYSFAYVLTD
jgi:hypothetical protein